MTKVYDECLKKPEGGRLARGVLHSILASSFVIGRDRRDEEWAGATFSPDGRWLFANVQTPGVTFAITGPWEEAGL